MGISIKNLTYQHKNSATPVIQNLSFEIKKNEIVSLFGVSGSGKSTLLKLITSFIKPKSGSVELLDIKPTDISYIRQDSMDMLFPWLTVKENLEFALKERNQLDEKAKERILYLTDMLGLTKKLGENCYPSQLSGGEKKRLSFACALTYQPKLILLDEAFTGIDFSLKWKLWSFLRTEIKRLKATAIVITHDFDEGIFLADRIVFLNAEKQIDKQQVIVHKTDTIAIEKALSEPSFMQTKEQTLKLYKEITNAI